MSIAYAFIDGAAFEKSAGALLPQFSVTLDDIDWDSLTRNASRIFYFDALPAQKPGQSDVVFESALALKMAHFSKLRRVKNLHVREGFARVRHGKKLNVLSQKGVDIALAVEVMTHVHLGNMDCARFFVNDLDFFPLIDSLSFTKVRSELYYDRRSTSTEMIEAADSAEELSVNFIYDALPMTKKQEFQITENGTRDPSWQLVKSGMVGQGDIFLYSNLMENKFMLEQEFSGSPHRLTCKSSHLLISHYQFVWKQEIVWETSKS